MLLVPVALEVLASIPSREGTKENKNRMKLLTDLFVFLRDISHIVLRTNVTVD